MKEFESVHFRWSRARLGILDIFSDDFFFCFKGTDYDFFYSFFRLERFMFPFTIMDSSKHLDVDKLPQKVGARAYLTNYGAGYLSSSDDEEVYHDDRNDLQDSFYSPSMAPSRKASASGPRHRIQSYTNKPTNYDYQKPPMRRNQSTASVETNSLLNELLENYNHDRDFSRKLESEFGRAKKQDECAGF